MHFHPCQPSPESAFAPALSRRALLRGSLCAGSLAWAQAPTAAGATTGVEAAAALAEIEKRSGGSLGLHAIDTGSGRTVSYKAAQRFAMASTFKLPLAAAVLHRNDQTPGVLDQRLPVRKSDLIAHSPVTETYLAQGFITARQACEAT